MARGVVCIWDRAHHFVKCLASITPSDKEGFEAVICMYPKFAVGHQACS
jgi:hypothetical protein